MSLTEIDNDDDDHLAGAILGQPSPAYDLHNVVTLATSPRFELEPKGDGLS